MRIFRLEDHVWKYFLYDFHNFLFKFLGNRTAVRLTDRNRLHDYINANEINVIYKNYSIRFYFDILEL